LLLFSFIFINEFFTFFFYLTQRKSQTLLLVDDGPHSPLLAGTQGCQHHPDGGGGDDLYHDRKHEEASDRDGGHGVCRSGRCTGLAGPYDGGGVGQLLALTVSEINQFK
jgi:hypothetical protein